MSGISIGLYLVGESYVVSNRQLLQRRLAILREQRAKRDIFNEFEDETSVKLTPEDRSLFFKLLDQYSAPYK